MRISDWSSDVCSSDLPGIAGAVEVLKPLEPQRRYPLRVVAIDREGNVDEAPEAGGVADPLDPDVAHAVRLRAQPRPTSSGGSVSDTERPGLSQIGSAPGRERGWQEGENPGGAG